MASDEFADLEIRLDRRDVTAYFIEFRFSQPGSDAESRLGGDQPVRVTIDQENLRRLETDPSAYGQSLSDSLFAEPEARATFARFRAAATTLGVPLRIRLMIGPLAPELHALRWETLRDPEDGSPLTTSENLVFSRYLSSRYLGQVSPRSKNELRALVLVANPTDLEDYGLAGIHVQGELDRARAALGEIPVLSLPDPDAGTRATLENLIAHLRDEPYDLIYLVCHGSLSKGEAWLWLEDEQGKSARTSGEAFITRLKELQKRPLLVVLASCESAGTGAGAALLALGPRLSEAGVPAVIAIQGQVSMEMMETLMPKFFLELQRDGVVDRALAVARGVVRERDDYWMPALFMRLKSGRICYTPGFGEDRDAFEKWPTLIRSIQGGRCTPIIGPGLYEPMLGSLRDIAQLWADKYNYPMANHERDSLPQVAQFLAINQDQRFPYDELATYLEQIIYDRYRDQLPTETQGAKPNLDELIDLVGALRWKQAPANPYRVLAQLPVRIYITTNFNNLMASALEEIDKDPQVVICPWNEHIIQTESVYEHEPDYDPSVERPLVYHLFGRLNQLDSMVLTEDDYFDYLIGVTENKDLIPMVVRRALADTALLFLGFRLDGWDFRALLRSILSQKGGKRRDRYTHIAAQIEPAEGRILEPLRARRFLEQYFSKGSNISIFWGNPEDFIKDLLPRLDGLVK